MPACSRLTAHNLWPLQVTGHNGQEKLGEALKGADLVIIPAGVPRKPGMTRDDLFNINASIVQKLAQGVAEHAPKVCTLASQWPLFFSPVQLSLQMLPVLLKCADAALNAPHLCCLQAILNIISNPVNSTVPIAAEVLKAAGVYDKKKVSRPACSMV